jgi:trimethylamine corrinoid protein
MATVEKCKDALKSFNKDETLKAVNDALAKGIGARKIFDGMVLAMKDIGKDFEVMNCFLPEVMKAAKAMREAFDILMPIMVESKEQPEEVGKIVFGTVKGDIHNVGKDMVVSVMSTAGFDVIDLGVDVAPSKYYEEAERNQADIVAVCAIMSSTIPIQKDVVDYFVEQGTRDKYKIMVGGGSTDTAWAEQIGADGWAKDAVEATDVALKLLGKK